METLMMSHATAADVIQKVFMFFFLLKVSQALFMSIWVWDVKTWRVIPSAYYGVNRPIEFQASDFLIISS